MRAFIAGFLSTLVFHQGVLTVLWWSGTLPRAPYDMARPSEQGPAKGPITPLRLAFSKSALCLSYQPGPGAATLRSSQHGPPHALPYQPAGRRPWQTALEE